MAPDSNQQSSTAATRRISPSQRSHASVTSSTAGRWSDETSRPARRESAASEPKTSSAPQELHRQTGTGAPQERLRERAQSRALESHSKKRAPPTPSGTKRTAFPASKSFSLNAVTRKNQLRVALYKSG